MEALFLYLIKSSLILALSMVLFLLLMTKETFHGFNRSLIHIISVLSLVLPIVNIGMYTPFSKIGVTLENLFGIGTTTADISEVVIDYNQPLITYNTVHPAVVYDTSVFDALTPFNYAAIIYFGVAVVLLLRLAYMYICVVHKINRCNREMNTSYELRNAVLLTHNGKEKPFSWFRWIVCSKEDLSDGGREIVAHEMAHVRKMHSLDILFVDLLIILQWFNPMVWIMKNVLKDIHEYEADEAVIAGGADIKHYQLLIIKKAVGARLYSIANSFNHSLTKKRITMMCKKKSNSWRCVRALYIVPIALFVACSFSSEKENDKSGNKVNENVATIEVYVPENVADSIVEVLDIVNKPDTLAEYPGGTVALMKYLQENVKYPAEAREQNIQGKCYVQFVVKGDGCIDCVNVARSSGSQLLDEEAVRVIKSLPRWNAAKHNGKEVNSQFTLPVFFRLAGGEAPPKKSEVKDCEKIPLQATVHVNLNDKEIYQVVEEQPQFVGGTAGLNDYLIQNIRVREEWYNDNSFKKDAFISFVIHKDGSISEPKILISSGNSDYDKELLRVVAEMPKWKPGKMHGEPVCVRHNIAVSQSSIHSRYNELQKNTKDKVKTALHFVQAEPTENIQDTVNAAVIFDNNAGQPLYIVDGVHLDNYTGNTNDIESITVLKSDVAISLYGDSGKDGAVIMTTKRGTVDSKKKLR